MEIERKFLVAALPEGINTPLGERGAGFSEGQNQRLAIARAVLRKAPVLLLDDVLSELDPGRQDFVLNQISSGQVFITCCEEGRFTKLGKTISIKNGSVI